jgi:redox-sensitive bicupin YhaK (pirin superfamily)
MEILHRDSLVRGGFAGLKETRLIRDKSINGTDENWDGLGQFVYLADARYLSHGETHMHSHKEIDIVTVMLEGRLTHEGSLKDGQSMIANQAQVQRAGGEGFSHNEVNPDASRSRLLQLWVLPENAGEPADYKFYNFKENNLTRIYGGHKSQSETFDSHTVIDVGVLKKGKKVSHQGAFITYVTNGNALINDVMVKDGDLIRGHDFDLNVTSESVQLTVISLQK